MKKAITLSAATLALLVAGASGASAVSAASVNAGQWNSTGNIGFTPNTQTPPVVTNPEAPEAPGVIVYRGTKGALAIDYASDLAFGQHEISAKSATYYAAADKTAFPGGRKVGAFVEMHDLRGLGTGNNTRLTVTQLDQFKKNGSDAYLTGAALSFSSGKAANAGGGTYPSTAEAGFTLKPGQAHTVMTTNGTVGQFLTSYGKAVDYVVDSQGNTIRGPISLSVPSGSALEGNFTATLQWDLTVD
ncbi:WxL domain-containing protein (plasmid) [Lactococcus cremoris]